MIDTDRQTGNIRQTDSPLWFAQRFSRPACQSPGQDDPLVSGHQPGSPRSTGRSPPPPAPVTTENRKTVTEGPREGSVALFENPCCGRRLFCCGSGRPSQPTLDAFPGAAEMLSPAGSRFAALNTCRIYSPGKGKAQCLRFASGSRVEFLHRESLRRWFAVLTPGRLRARLSPEVHLGNNSARPKVTQHAQGPFPLNRSPSTRPCRKL